jgi:hypothetical protein
LLTFSYDGTTLRPMPAPDAQARTEPAYEPRRVASGQELVTTPLALGPLPLRVARSRDERRRPPDRRRQLRLHRQRCRQRRHQRRGGIEICVGGAGVDTFRNCETQYP